MNLHTAQELSSSANPAPHVVRCASTANMYTAVIELPRGNLISEAHIVPSEQESAPSFDLHRVDRVHVRVLAPNLPHNVLLGRYSLCCRCVR